jgi:protoporphyrinogen IX oxidase
MEYYDSIKAVHLIFVVSWFAGLFYIVRLFIYQVEAYTRAEPDRTILSTEYKRIERLLFNIIMNPAMALTIITALAMIYLNSGLLQTPWFQVKLGLVVGLIAYHFSCGKIMTDLRQDVVKWTSGQLRMWNEVATIFLVAIIFVVILKSAFDWIYGVLGLVAFAVLIMLAVRLAKKIRG